MNYLNKIIDNNNDNLKVNSFCNVIAYLSINQRDYRNICLHDRYLKLI